MIFNIISNINIICEYVYNIYTYTHTHILRTIYNLLLLDYTLYLIFYILFKLYSRTK